MTTIEELVQVVALEQHGPTSVDLLTLQEPQPRHRGNLSLLESPIGFDQGEF